MFGYVIASWKELNKQQQERYGAVYCGICRAIRQSSGNVARLGLSYDMAFLALLHMSLYEPEEKSSHNACLMHPFKRRSWINNEYVRYCADMNVALSYYNCLDDWEDDRKQGAHLMAAELKKHLPDIERRWPRQCKAIREALEVLHRLEAENCPNPDEPAAAFGELMAQLLVVREDHWQEELSQMGFALGRFIYLLDAMLDYDRDKRRGKYNPFLAGHMEKDWPQWEQYLVLAMARCTENYEKLPLVQDKGLLDNILYSGVWINYRAKQKKQEDPGHDG